MPPDAPAVVDRLFREEWGRAVATLIRLFGDFDLAEEAVQEAFVVALERWPRDGVPANPGAWITTTARHRAIDRLRRARRLAETADRLRREAEIEAELAAAEPVGMPDEPEVLGLLALMLLHDARRDARTDPEGALVLLDDQERARWDRSEIQAGRALLERTLRMRRPGPYQVHAAIAALHDEAPAAGATDWPQIAALYAELARLEPSPVVELNRAVAIAMAEGPARGLETMAPLAESLADYPYFHAASADLLRRLGRRSEAASAYERARALLTNETERAFIDRRLAEVRTPG